MHEMVWHVDMRREIVTRTLCSRLESDRWRPVCDEGILGFFSNRLLCRKDGKDALGGGPGMVRREGDTRGNGVRRGRYRSSRLRHVR